jgi:hypothetical protein
MNIENNLESPSADLRQMISHLEDTAVYLEECGCYVALSDDKSTIFTCPANIDGAPERDDDRHMNWSQVTAPEPAFAKLVNDTFGTAFDWQKFAGR